MQGGPQTIQANSALRAAQRRLRPRKQARSQASGKALRQRRSLEAPIGPAWQCQIKHAQAARAGRARQPCARPLSLSSACQQPHVQLSARCCLLAVCGRIAPLEELSLFKKSSSTEMSVGKGQGASICEDAGLLAQVPASPHRISLHLTEHLPTRAASSARRRSTSCSCATVLARNRSCALSASPLACCSSAVCDATRCVRRCQKVLSAHQTPRCSACLQNILQPEPAPSLTALPQSPVAAACLLRTQADEDRPAPWLRRAAARACSRPPRAPCCAAAAALRPRAPGAGAVL